MKKLAVFLVIVWMAVIFYLSTEAGAYTGVYNIGVMQIVKHSFGIDMEAVKLAGHSLIAIARKCMHFSLYAVMGILACNAVKCFGVRYKYLTAVVITSVYALLDELHQIFVPERTSSLRDVLVDILGALCAVCLVFIINRIRRLLYELKASGIRKY